MKIVTACDEDLKAKVRSVPEFLKKTNTVYSLDDLIEQMGGSFVAKPAVGIWYEGARRIDSDPNRRATTVELVFSLFLLTETSVLSKRIDTQTPSHVLLDNLRSHIQGTRAPTGHFWEFQLEAAAKQKGNLAVWVQRWTTNVPAIPTANSQ